MPYFHAAELLDAALEEEGGTLIARKVGEAVQNTLGAVVGAIDIPLGEHQIQLHYQRCFCWTHTGILWYPLCVQAWWKTQLARPTGSLTRTSTPAVSARESSPLASPSTTAVPVARAYATTALRGGGPCHLAAGTTRWGSVTAATRNPGSSRSGSRVEDK